VQILEKSRKSGDFKRVFEKMQRDNISFVHDEHPDFPERLKILNDCPLALYVRGTLPDDAVPSVGMVGARACSGYGREAAGRFARELAAGGVQIISGMAVGIDSHSAKGALAVGGRTFAVLGSGIDVIYPAVNIGLYYEIVTSGGGIISEYPLGTQPISWHFPHRNRLISALSDRLLVIEAGKKSGSLSTACHALDQGKDVYALPGRINDCLSEGCNMLIYDGAGVLVKPHFLLEEIFRGKHPADETEPAGAEAGAGVPAAAGAETGAKSDVGRVLSLIGNEPVGIREIQEKSGLDIAAAGSVLTELELAGLINRLPGGFYGRVI
jgi:DNA processing protein